MTLLSQISCLLVWVWSDLVCLSFCIFQFLRLNLWSLYVKQALYHWGTSLVLFWLFLSRRILPSFPGSPWKQQVLNLQSPCWWVQKTETSQWDWDSQNRNPGDGLAGVRDPGREFCFLFFVPSCDAYKAEAKRRLDTWFGQLNMGTYRSGLVLP